MAGLDELRGVDASVSRGCGVITGGPLYLRRLQLPPDQVDTASHEKVIQLPEKLAFKILVVGRAARPDRWLSIFSSHVLSVKSQMRAAEYMMSAIKHRALLNTSVAFRDQGA